MKMVFAALAFAIASPVVAQDTATDPHASHAPAKEHGLGQAGSSVDEHAGHDMQGECCCEQMKAAGAAMDCCDKPAAAAGPAEADPHAGHTMGGQ